MKKVAALFMVLVMVLALAGCGKDQEQTDNNGGTDTGNENGSNETANTGSDPVDATGVKITFLNTKGEIQAQLESVAQIFEAETGIELEIISTGAGESPFQRMTALYASGNAPTLSMMDAGDLDAFADKMLDLSDAKWVTDAMPGSLEVARVNNQLLAFPFAVEGFGLIYNQAAIEAATGTAFDPEAINTKADLEALFAAIEAGGTAPIIISPLDWSLAAHYTQIAYARTGVSLSGQNELMQQLAAGELTFENFEGFGSLMDTFDFLASYNLDANDPLSGTYDTGAEAVATGDAAFWFMGNWAWPQIDEMSGDNDAFGFLPVPLDMPNETNKISAGPTKYVAIDQDQSSDEQQAAALQFLEWLVYEESGQTGLVETCSIIPAFLNIDKAPDDPLAQSILEYMGRGDVYGMVLGFPSDYWAEVGAYYQEYLGGYIDRTELYDRMEQYWANAY